MQAFEPGCLFVLFYSILLFLKNRSKEEETYNHKFIITLWSGKAFQMSLLSVDRFIDFPVALCLEMLQ